MNYLGHAWLSFGDAGVTAGNMIADHVKGKIALSRYPEEVQKGILLHRKIDEYFDEHPAIKRAKVYFRPGYGLYSGAIVDTVFDHFLANDPAVFPDDVALKKFSSGVYEKLNAYTDCLPDTFLQYFPHMKQHDWLFGYRSLKGIERSLSGLHRRAAHMPEPLAAYQTFVTNFYSLNQCYFEIADDIVAFVKQA